MVSFIMKCMQKNIMKKTKNKKEKKKYADFLIDTSEGFEDTRKQVVTVFEKLKAIARDAPRN